jgi:hypothetical protein
MLYRNSRSFYGLFLLVTGIFVSCQQQANKVADEPKIIQTVTAVNDSTFLFVDKSPMDMIYFPEDYPKEKMISSNTDNLTARVIYSRPQKNGRLIFTDSLVTKNFIQHYGQEWRLGANEATEIEFFKQVTINEKKFSPGRYVIYCIPYPDKWKIIFNSNLFSWGLHMDKTKDLSEIELPVTKVRSETEFFTMIFLKAPYGCDLVMAWGDIKVIMPVHFS